MLIITRALGHYLAETLSTIAETEFKEDDWLPTPMDMPDNSTEDQNTECVWVTFIAHLSKEKKALLSIDKKYERTDDTSAKIHCMLKIGDQLGTKNYAFYIRPIANRLELDYPNANSICIEENDLHKHECIQQKLGILWSKLATFP